MNDAQAFDLATLKRRAILFADLVESVRLYERFEARTIDHWRRFAALARDRVAPSHGGRLVRTVGDGLLLEFETAAGATAAAFALHEALAGFNGPDAGEAAMWLRAGVHIADVVAEENELWGSGVNLAARLASLAQPGQTVASAQLRNELNDGVQASLEDLGPRYLKHMSEPVHAFLISRPDTSAFCLARPPATEDMRPAVAVVPFVALPADPHHDALGHAVADDVIANLSRHPGLRVLSRGSTGAIRGTTLDLARLRTLLGASFMLSGHFYVRGQRVRMTAELCELQSGQVLWAGSVSGDVGALFEGEDNLVPQLVAQITEHVMAHELARVRSLPMTSLASYSLLLGAGGLLNSFVPQDFTRAREALEHLADRHPRQPAPRALLSSWHLNKLLQGWTDDPQAESRMARQQAQQALDIDPNHPNALIADGAALVFSERDFAGAAQRYRQALEHDPQHPQAWARLSESQSEAGNHEEALASANRALELSPLDRHRFLYESYAARAAFVAQRFKVACAHARSSVRLHALHAPAHRMLIAALWLGEEPDAARQAAAAYLRLIPGANACGTPQAHGVAAIQSPFVKALHAAGVPQ